MDAKFLDEQHIKWIRPTPINYNPLVISNSVQSLT